MCRSKVCFIWEVVTRISLGWFSNWTATSVYDCARKSNNWLDQYWAPEVDFSPFRALSRRQMTFPFLLLNQPIVYSGRQDLPFLEFRSISRAAKPKIPFIDLSSLRNQTETLATHATKIYVSHTWIGCIRKRSYTEFGMPMLQKETPGSVNVCWMESAPMAPFLSSENNLLFTREWTHFHICDCALGFSLVLKERCKTSQNWAIWK